MNVLNFLGINDAPGQAGFYGTDVLAETPTSKTAINKPRPDTGLDTELGHALPPTWI